MARELSPIIDSILNQETQPVFLAVDITLPDNITVVRAAETELTVSSLNLFGASVACNITTYPALLKSEPAVKFAKSKSPSGGEMSIFDLDHVLGVLTGQIETVLENSRIVITTCWQKSDGNFEADIYFIGRVRDVKAEDSETKFTVISDTDVKTALVASRSLTQRCLADYGDDRCGRPASLIAPGETCSNIFDDGENGCLSKRWQFRFWGVPILSLDSDISGNGGWGGGTVSTGGGCASVENKIAVLDANGLIQQIKLKSAKRGMIVVDAFKRTAVIEEIEFIYAEDMFEIICENGAKTEVSDTHPLIKDIHDADGTKAESMRVGDEVLCFNLRLMKYEKTRIKSIEKIHGREVAKVMLSNQSSSLYLTCSDEENEYDFIMICGHNNKLPTVLN